MKQMGPLTGLKCFCLQGRGLVLVLGQRYAKLHWLGGSVRQARGRAAKLSCHRGNVVRLAQKVCQVRGMCVKTAVGVGRVATETKTAGLTGAGGWESMTPTRSLTPLDTSRGIQWEQCNERLMY